MTNLRHPWIMILLMLGLAAAGCNLPARSASSTPGGATPTFSTSPVIAPSGAPGVTIIPKDLNDTPAPPTPTLTPDAPNVVTVTPLITPDYQPVNRKDPNALIAGLRAALQQKDPRFFAQLATANLDYVDYIEGGQPVDRAKLLEDLTDRFAASSPQCTQYGTYEQTLQIWTSGWNLPWQIDRICYQGCNQLNPPHTSQTAAFFFRPNPNGEYELSVVWLNDDNLWRTVYKVEMHGCSDPYQPQPTPTTFSCPGTPPTRLKTGERAFASALSSTPNRVRSAPGTSANIIGLIQPRQVVEIVDGPQCANGYVWWKVRTAGESLTGWTAEGNTASYWLEPCTIAQCGQP